MDINLTEDEQVEQIKQWWRENGKSIVAGVIIGVGGLFGWRYWIDYQDRIASEAAAQYEVVLIQLGKAEFQPAIENAQQLIDQYGSTSYVSLARLAQAKAHAELTEFEKAKAPLTALITDQSDSHLAWIARNRLALLMFQEKQYDQALEQLDINYPIAFTAVYEELKGDIFTAKGDKDQARKAYQLAKLSQPQPGNINFLQQKIDDLGFAQ